MSDHHQWEPLSVGELSQPHTENDPVTCAGTLPAGAEPCETGTKAPEEGKSAETCPEIPPEVYLSDMFWKRSKVYTQEQQTTAWSNAAETVQKYSDEMVKRWKEEIDTYLVFAGLFSAVLTTFNVQSYVLLQPATPDPSIDLLRQISSQLSSFSINPPFVNSTQPSSTARANANTPPPVPRWAVWLNALWFSSLILSLTSASVGIMVKQWLNEYSSGVSGNSRPVARVRQYRLNNIRTWRVEDIICAIPVLLQLSLALFLAGILILLWVLHSTVAAIASTLVGLLAIFTIVTTLLPLVNHECSYLTPHIRAVSAIWQPKRYAYWICASMSRKRSTGREILTSTQRKLSTFCQHIRLYVSIYRLRCLWLQVRDIARRLRYITSPPEAWKESKNTWQGQERSTIDDQKDNLDIQTLVEAYSSTLYPSALSDASVCLMDLMPVGIIGYFKQLHKSAREHFGPKADSKDSPLVRNSQHQLLWLQIVLCVTYSSQPPLSDEEEAALGVYFKYGSWSSGMQATDAVWAASTCNALSDHLYTATLTSSAAKLIDEAQLSAQKRSLIDTVMERETPLTNILLPAVTGAYRHLRLKQAVLTGFSSGHPTATHTEYLKSVNLFLLCAKQALTPSLPATDLETVRAQARDVVAGLIRTLLALFVEDRVRTTIEWKYLRDVIWTLAHLDDAHVEDCVSDDLVPDILNLVERIETYSTYVDNGWVSSILWRAGGFKENVLRVKNKAATMTSVVTST